MSLSGSDFWSAMRTDLGNTPASTDLNTNSTELFPITDQQILLVSGPDSAKFMQGQFTCNLNDINPSSYRPGACCNPKGRMMTSFNLAQSGDNEYLLSMNDTLSDSSLAHLKKYMVFFKTSMAPVEKVLAGLKGANSESILKEVFGECPKQDFQQVSHEAGIIIKLPFSAGFELWLNPSHASLTIKAILSSGSKCSLSDENGWHLNRIQNGLAQVTDKSREDFIPQMLNFGQTGAVSFSKGCYTGQEIVARMQYLGKLKRHLYRGKVPAGTNIELATAIFSQGHESAVSQVVCVAYEADHAEILLVLDKKYLQTPLFLSESNGPQIELLSLPYEIEVEEPKEG
ncbi:MAG: hypothetical protein V7785_00275 [Bermanella sp.]